MCVDMYLYVCVCLNGGVKTVRHYFEFKVQKHAGKVIYVRLISRMNLITRFTTLQIYGWTLLSGLLSGTEKVQLSNMC